MPKYQVLNPIKIGPNPNDVLSIGDEAEFSEKEAKELIACGALAELKVAAADDDTSAADKKSRKK